MNGTKCVTKEKPTQATFGLVLGLNHVMLGGNQGLDYCKTKQRHTYTNTWIIARMSTMRRILVVFMGLAIGCFCQIITSSWRMKISNYHSIAVYGSIKSEFRHKLDIRI